VAINGDSLKPFGYAVTAGRQGITPIDSPGPTGGRLVRPRSNLRPWYWTALGMALIVLFVNFRLRDSRLGRGLDRGARGRGGRGEHGRAARAYQAAGVR